MNLNINENIKELVEKVMADEALMNKFKECNSVEEAYKLATSIVDGYTLEEFQQTMIKLNGMISNQTKGELTDDDLQQVAGGSKGTDIADTVLQTVSATAGIVSAVSGIVSASAGIAGAAASAAT